MTQTLGNAAMSCSRPRTIRNQSVYLLNSDIGNLTDADLGKVGARIQALQIQGQLAVQSVALGNQ